MQLLTHRGGCHCGAVRFEVIAPKDLEVFECNCSICSKAGYLHLIVPASRFNLIEGMDVLTTYTFSTAVAKHTFCKICGIKSFYIPRSNPDGFSVNARCLDKESIGQIKIDPFDGENWEENCEKLKHFMCCRI